MIVITCIDNGMDQHHLPDARIHNRAEKAISNGLAFAFDRMSWCVNSLFKNTQRSELSTSQGYQGWHEVIFSIRYQFLFHTADPAGTYNQLCTPTKMAMKNKAALKSHKKPLKRPSQGPELSPPGNSCSACLERSTFMHTTTNVFRL